MQVNSSPSVRRAVLGWVFHEHSEEWTARELREEIDDGARAAIVDLLAAGLVRREGDYVRPTRPVLNCYRLELP